MHTLYASITGGQKARNCNVFDDPLASAMQTHCVGLTWIEAHDALAQISIFWGGSLDPFTVVHNCFTNPLAKVWPITAGSMA